MRSSVLDRGAEERGGGGFGGYTLPWNFDVLELGLEVGREAWWRMRRFCVYMDEGIGQVNTQFTIKGQGRACI